MKYKDFTLLPKDLQGWNGNSNVFGQLIEQVRPKVIIEIGSWKGQSAINMAKACKRLGLDTKIYCVDTWLGAVEFMKTEYDPERDLMKLHGYPQVYYQFLSNIIHEGVADMIEPIPNTSYIASHILPQADLIYVDGDHSYESVAEDIALYWKLLNEGGVMFGDDYHAFPGVRRAVDENFKDKQILEGNFWVTKK